MKMNKISHQSKSILIKARHQNKIRKLQVINVRYALRTLQTHCLCPAAMQVSALFALLKHESVSMNAIYVGSRSKLSIRLNKQLKNRLSIKLSLRHPGSRWNSMIRTRKPCQILRLLSKSIQTNKRTNSLSKLKTVSNSLNKLKKLKK